MPDILRPPSGAFVLFALLALAGCKAPSMPSVKIPGVYRLDVQQGNVIDDDMIAMLEPGMERRKVRFILGTPLVADTFNPERWDYYYSFKEGGGETDVRRISVYFQDDRLVRVMGESEIPLDGRGSELEDRPERVVVVPAKQGGGLFEALTPPFLKRDKREDALEKSKPDTGKPAGATATAALGDTESDAASAPADEARADAAPTSEDTVASAKPAAVTPDAEASGYFTRLFQGYGREPLPGGEPVASEAPPPSPAAEEPDPDGAPARVEEPAPAPAEPAAARVEPTAPDPDAVASGDQPAGEATEEEKGFFSRMVKKLRREREESPEPAAPEPDPEATGEEGG